MEEAHVLLSYSSNSGTGLGSNYEPETSFKPIKQMVADLWHAKVK